MLPSKKIPLFGAITTSIALALSSTIAQAVEAISLNVQNVTAANSAMAASALAGAPGVRFPNWTPFFGAPVTTAVDSNGRTLALSFSYTPGSVGLFGGGVATDGDQRMIGTYLDHNNGTASTFTISSIPYSSYDIYVYCLDATTSNNRGGSITVGGTTKYIRTGSNVAITAATGAGYVEATDTSNNGATTTMGNYVRITGLSGPSQTVSTVALNMGDGTQRLKIAGFQIVNTGAALAAATTAPIAPVISEIVPRNGSAVIVWGRAIDAVTYSVRRGTSVSGPFTEVGTTDSLTTKFTDTGLTNGNTYFYQVASVNVVGSSVSAVASAVPDDGALLRAVGVQIRSGGAAIAAATSAGAPGARQNNWNSYVGSASGSMTTLVDNTGTSVAGMSFTHAAGNNNFASAGSQTTDDLALYSGHHDKFDGTDATVVVSGIPYARYDVYFYVKDDTVDRAGSVTLGSTTYFVSGIYGGGAGNPLSDGSGYRRSADTEASFASGSTTVLDYTTIDKGNYVKFTNVTGGSFTATYRAVATSAAARRLKVSGFQIVDTTPAGAAPATPSGLSAIGGNNQVVLSWNTVPSSTSYTVKRSSAYFGPFADLATIGTNGYTDTTAANGSFYYYTVTANNSGGSSAEATPVSAAPLGYVPVAIGLDLRGAAGSALAPSALAGAPSVRLPNWNSLVVPSAAGGSTTPAVLVDSSGSVVAGSTVTYTNGSSPVALAITGTSNDTALYGTYADIYGNTATLLGNTPATLSATGIPYATYDVYFYVRNDGADRAARINVNGTDYFIRGGLSEPNSSGLGYVGAAGTDGSVPSAIPQGNFLRVSGLSGDLSVVLDGHDAGNVASRLKLGGIQIVNASAPTVATSAPGIVSGVVVTGGVGQNTISWSPVNGATGYSILRSATADGTFASIATVSAFATSYTDTGLPDDATFYYQVVATNTIGSGPVSGTVAGSTALSPVTGLKVTPGNAQVVLAWTGTSSATSYEVRMRTASGTYDAPVQTVTATTATVSGLTNGDTYFFVVRAVAGALASADSAEVMGVPFDTAVLRSIGINFTNAAGAMTADVASGVPFYRQGSWNNYQIDTAGAVTVLGPVAGSYVDSTGVGLPGFSTEFTVSGPTVFSYNRGTTGDPMIRTIIDQDQGISNVILRGVPYARYDILVYVYDDTANRAGVVSVNDTVNITNYYIRGIGSTEGAGNPTATGEGYVQAHQTTLATDGGPTIAQGNYIHISSLTSSDIQLSFQAVTAIDATRRIKVAGVQIVNTSGSLVLPAAATSVSAVAGNAQVSLSWTAAPGVSSYHVRRATVAGGPYLTVASGVTASTYTDTSVTNGTTYYYVVTSVSDIAGTNSAEVTASPNLPAPPAPLNLVASGKDGSVDLAWSAASGATSYTIRRSTNSGGPYTDVSAGVVTATSYSDASVTNGTTYYYVVAAANGTSVGANSNQASATPNGNALEAWRQANFGSGATNSGNAADTADADGDGIANLVEYATGTDPLVFSAPVVTVGRSGNLLALTFTRIADVTLTYTVEGSNDLVTWASVSTSTGAQNVAGQITVEDNVSLTSQSRRFLRLKVTY